MCRPLHQCSVPFNSSYLSTATASHQNQLPSPPPHPSPSSPPPPEKEMVCSVSESAIIERSLSFRNWEPEAEDARSRDDEDGGPKPNSAASALRTAVPVPDLMLPQYVPDYYSSPKPLHELDAAATKLQKVYKSYRTRRNLADCAVVIEELWWKALDFACLKHSSVSFFKVEKQETAVSRWSRARTRVAKLGKGLSKDEKAQKLALQHWLEAIDPRHRYGHNLHLYYDIWSESQSCQPFFYWLDVGDGRELSLDKCSRAKLNSQCIRYLGPNEREEFEVIVKDGKLVYKQTADFVNTSEDSKWIFVLSTARSLYVGQKKKGTFQHSSFLSGGATTAAGRLVAKEGVLKAIWPYSGHYLPTEEHFKEFISFLQENNVDLSNVKRCSVDDDEFPGANKENNVPSQAPKADEVAPVAETPKGGSDIGDVAQKAMALEFSRRVSGKWTSGAGPRIGCVREYSADLQTRALEHVNLSPRVALSPVQGSRVPIPSPRPSPKVRLSPKLQFMGIPTPTVSLTLPKHRRA